MPFEQKSSNQLIDGLNKAVDGRPFVLVVLSKPREQDPPDFVGWTDVFSNIKGNDKGIRALLLSGVKGAEKMIEMGKTPRRYPT